MTQLAASLPVTHAGLTARQHLQQYQDGNAVQYGLSMQMHGAPQLLVGNAEGMMMLAWSVGIALSYFTVAIASWNNRTAPRFLTCLLLLGVACLLAMLSCSARPSDAATSRHLFLTRQTSIPAVYH